MQLDPVMQEEVYPKNILMIGPTGVGKTEIARRLAKLANAPFVKVEATKFTEVGYVGKDVESIIRDLVDSAIKMHREQQVNLVSQRAEDAAEERILDELLPPVRDESATTSADTSTRQVFRKKLRQGDLDDKEIEIDAPLPKVGMEIMTPPGMEDMAGQIQEMFSNVGNKRTQRRKLTVKQALGLFQTEEATKLIDEEEIKAEVIYCLGRLPFKQAIRPRS